MTTHNRTVTTIAGAAKSIGQPITKALWRMSPMSVPASLQDGPILVAGGQPRALATPLDTMTETYRAEGLVLARTCSGGR